jgi:hypothetical protein
VFSLNVPVPGSVRRLAANLRPQLADFETVRDDHTLVVKRFPDDLLDGDQPAQQLATLRERLRPVISGLPAVEARVAGIDAFDRPVRGDGPVVYLAIDSLGLYQIHETLTDAFGVVDDLEGEAYTPHVTVARDGPQSTVERLRARSLDAVSWTVSELVIWDATHSEPAARFGLPA